MADLELDSRLADEVTTLSTKLVTEVAKSSHLEETILHLRRENAQIKARLSDLEPIASEHQETLDSLKKLETSHEEVKQQKLSAEAKNKQLEGEVEDLTASLFNEANEMVSNASREAYNFKIKNRKLIEELAEKDSIIDNLQDQLRDLKGLFVKMEESQKSSSRVNTPHVEKGAFDFSPSEIENESNELHQILYGVKGRAIRFDLQPYQVEFKAFVLQLIKKDFTFDLASLKTLKYFRRLWTEEIEPSVPIIPSVTGNNFINRWSKGKSFWSLLVEGKAIIEPVAGVNETFKLTYKGVKKGDEVPVALEEACAFCGEHKNDVLEHARLYNLKLYGPTTETGISGVNTTEIGGEPHAVVGTFPLCNFCLVKLRAICTFFAKLRLVHSNIYKLPQDSAFDDVAYVNNFQFKRNSEAPATPQSDPGSEPIFVKLYLMMLVLRAKIFWSRIGFWDTHEDVESVNLDEISLDVFRDVAQDNAAFDGPDMEVASVVESPKAVPPQSNLESEVVSSQLDAVKAVKEQNEAGDSDKTSEGFGGARDLNSSLEAPDVEQVSEDKPHKIVAVSQTEPKSKKKGKKGKTGKNSEGETSNEVEAKSPVKEASPAEPEDSAEGEFEDSLDTFDGAPSLQRRKSKSKEFKAKINKDLDNTLAALQESLE